MKLVKLLLCFSLIGLCIGCSGNNKSKSVKSSEAISSFIANTQTLIDNTIAVKPEGTPGKPLSFDDIFNIDISKVLKIGIRPINNTDTGYTFFTEDRNFIEKYLEVFRSSEYSKFYEERPSGGWSYNIIFYLDNENISIFYAGKITYMHFLNNERIACEDYTCSINLAELDALFKDLKASPGCVVEKGS